MRLFAVLFLSTVSTTTWEFAGLLTDLNRAASAADKQTDSLSQALGELIGHLHSLPGAEPANESAILNHGFESLRKYKWLGSSDDALLTEEHVANLIEAFGVFLRNWRGVPPQHVVEFLDQILDLANDETVRIRLTRVASLDLDPVLILIDKLRMHLMNLTRLESRARLQG